MSFLTNIQITVKKSLDVKISCTILERKLNKINCNVQTNFITRFRYYKHSQN